MSFEIDESDWNICQSIEELLDYLQITINDKESSIRISSVLGILLICALTSDEKLVKLLKSLLLSDDAYIRGAAALSIGILGAYLDDPIPFIDMLKLMLVDEARFVKRNASVGLALILSASTSREKRYQLLEKLVSSSYWYYRLTGVIGLGFFCEEGNLTSVIKRLKPLLNDSDIDVRIGAVIALGFIAKKFIYTEDLLLFLKSCLLDYDPAVIHSAKVVLNLLSLD
ncbi:MAG: HEAT repeat domain-containing protein [Candidatus Helarchaeota archaeon]